MRRFLWRMLMAAAVACGQPPLHFKTRSIDTRAAANVTGEIQPLHGFGREHLLLQFEAQPSPALVAELRSRGISVLQDVPENGLLVSVDRRVAVHGLGVRFSAPIEAADKISPLLLGAGFALVEFHPDADMDRARALVLNLGINLRDNPDLNPRHLLIQDLSPAAISALAHRDEVAYIFPASSALIAGIPTQPCIGAVTVNGTTAQSIPAYGSWSPTRNGGATLGYVFSRLTSKLDGGTQESEIERAMAQWADAVAITWQAGTVATAPHTVNILFASGAHGDGFPFDGPGGVVAHTFYPSPPNPEPIAGDMHFDDSESWHIGANTDLFSVALHELGHALGLGHSDNPNAVMYPYYSIHSGLSPVDIAAIQTLYAARVPVAPPNPAPTPAPAPSPSPAGPLVLNVNAPPAITTAATLSFSGLTSGGKAPAVVSWFSAQGSGMAQGSASWTISAIPLATGTNSITITATDNTSRVSQTITILRQLAPPPAGSAPDTTPPSLAITSPSSTSVSTSSATLVFSGSANDNIGVTSVTWSTNTGSSGSASGTTQWTATIPLLVGSNAVTIQAHDAAGNVGWRSVVVTRQ